MPAGLLAAMLQGVQAERGDRRGIVVPKNAEDPAFLAQSVIAVSQIARARELRLASGVVEPSRHGHLPLVPCRSPIS